MIFFSLRALEIINRDIQAQMPKNIHQTTQVVEKASVPFGG